MSVEPVRAAGGAVWRRNEKGSLDVVLVHRPRYDDWTFPKGKLNRDETDQDEDAALREVEEETGLWCSLGPELVSMSYTDAKGRPKVVRYWAMQVRHRRDRPPDDEVDEWRWISEQEAEQLLTYPRDRGVLQALRQVVL